MGKIFYTYKCLFQFFVFVQNITFIKWKFALHFFPRVFDKEKNKEVCWKKIKSDFVHVKMTKVTLFVLFLQDFYSLYTGNSALPPWDLYSLVYIVFLGPPALLAHASPHSRDNPILQRCDRRWEISREKCSRSYAYFFNYNSVHLKRAKN